MPNGSQSPAEIARETLRKLAAERLQPTPDNFRLQYHRIAGTTADEAFPSRALGGIVAELPRSNAAALKVVHDFERAIASGQWPTLRTTLHELVRMATETPPAWGSLIRQIVDGLDGNAPGADPVAHRRELQRVLGSNHADTQVLFARLRGLANGWSKPTPPDEADANGHHGNDGNGATGLGRLAPALARLIWRGVMPMAAGHPAIANELDLLASALGKPADEEQLAAIADRLESLTGKLEWLGEDQHAIRDTLLGLLRLIVDNIGELVLEDSWLHGQIGAISQCFEGPLDIRVLDEIERRLREVIAKQSRLKRHLSEAQTRLQSMLAGFLERLAGMKETTGTYQATLSQCAKQIAGARSLDELSTVVEHVLRETQAVHETTARTGVELDELKSQVEAANLRIENLQRELDETSELVRHDSLTGTLNRRGIDEALVREAARCRRRSEALCIAVLDIDGFKHVNDTFGHHTGDAALQHLVQVTRECLRPPDIVGRYGGEEFVILLPETVAAQAMTVLTRLQRELTRRYFLADNQRLLITFSAGIAQLNDGEETQAAVDRADKAMYAAKRAGKNRVLLAG